jgi:hypothetical protein
LLHVPLAAAQAPQLASMAKQIFENVVLGSVKNELIGSLAGMGCKGSTIAGLAAAASAGGAKGAAGAASGPRGATGGMDPAAMQRAMEMAQKQMGAQGMQLTPEQQALMRKAMAQMQTASSQPLSPAETAAVFDDLAALGLVSDSMRKEAKDCISAAPPGSTESLGSAGAMMRSTVLPAARQAKERMADLSPDEQKQLADGMVEALNSASPADRKAFFDGMGLGFFPAPVVEQVRSRVKP